MSADLPSKGVIDFLHSLGVRLGTYEICQLVALAKVKVSGRRFTLDEGGFSAFVTAIKCGDETEIEHSHPLDVILHGTTIDLICWTPAGPNGWALYTGNAAVLGAIEPQYCLPAPVLIHRNVLGWMQHGCSGLVLTGATDAINQEILARIDTPVAEDQLHAAELRRIAALPRRIPTVLVRKNERVAA